MKKIFFIILCIMTLGSGVALNAAVVVYPTTLVAATKEKTVKLYIPSMHCPSCPFKIRKTLEKLNGIKSVTVSGKNKTAVVTYDPLKLSLKAITEAIKNVGYPVVEEMAE
jgi:mercuric ion binding protein